MPGHFLNSLDGRWKHCQTQALTYRSISVLSRWHLCQVPVCHISAEFSNALRNGTNDRQTCVLVTPGRRDNPHQSYTSSCALFCERHCLWPVVCTRPFIVVCATTSSRLDTELHFTLDQHRLLKVEGRDDGLVHCLRPIKSCLGSRVIAYQALSKHK